MKEGRVVRARITEDIFARIRRPYTRALDSRGSCRCGKSGERPCTRGIVEPFVRLPYWGLDRGA